MPEKDRWNVELVKIIWGTLAQPNPNMPGQHVPIQISIPTPAHPIPHQPQPQHEQPSESRSIYLRRGDFEKYGLQDNCPGCIAIKAGLAAQNHKETCRSRMEECIRNDDSQKHRRESVIAQQMAKADMERTRQ